MKSKQDRYIERLEHSLLGWESAFYLLNFASSFAMQLFQCERYQIVDEDLDFALVQYFPYFKQERPDTQQYMRDSVREYLKAFGITTKPNLILLK